MNDEYQIDIDLFAFMSASIWYSSFLIHHLKTYVMKTEFEILKAIRRNYLKAIEGLSLETLNTIPEGFNNNIIWNVTHAIVTQQRLCYLLSDNKIRIPKGIVGAYKKGSKPTRPATQAEVDQSIDWLTASIGWIEEDYEMGIFKEYKVYPTSFGYTLSSIEEAITFNNVHEGMHLGWIGAIKKSLKIG